MSINQINVHTAGYGSLGIPPPNREPLRSPFCMMFHSLYLYHVCIIKYPDRQNRPSLHPLNPVPAVATRRRPTACRFKHSDAYAVFRRISLYLERAVSASEQTDESPFCVRRLLRVRVSREKIV